MLFVNGSSDASQIASLQFELDLSRRMEKANVKLIEQQRKIIMKEQENSRRLQMANARLIEGQHKMLMDHANQIFELGDHVEELKFSVYEARKASGPFQLGMELNRLRQLKQVSDSQIKELKKKNNVLSNQIHAYQAAHQYIRTAIGMIADQEEQLEQERLDLENQRNERSIPAKDKDIDNFPKDLMDQFSKLKLEVEPEEVMEDDQFKKELAKRLTCKICLSDVERLRCGECYKGVCDGCYSKVKRSSETGEKLCPHCRSHQKGFEPIILSRI